MLTSKETITKMYNHLSIILLVLGISQFFINGNLFSQVENSGYKYDLNPARSCFSRLESWYKNPYHTSSDSYFGWDGYSTRVNKVAYTRDGKYLITAGDDGTLRLYDARTNAFIKPFLGHKKNVYSFILSPDETLIASLDDYGTTIVWNVLTGEIVTSFNSSHIYFPANFMQFTSDGSKILIAEYSTVNVFDSFSGQLLNTIRFSYGGLITSIAISPDDKIIATGLGDGTIILWDASTIAYINRFFQHYKAVSCIAFSPDGKKLASGGNDNTIYIWDINTGNKVNSFSHSNYVTSVSYVMNGSMILSTSDDKKAVLWNASTGSVIQSFNGHISAVKSAAISVDGKKLATASWDWTMKLWNTADGTVISTLMPHTGDVSSISFISDDKNILTTGMGTKKIWDAVSGDYLGEAPISGSRILFIKNNIYVSESIIIEDSNSRINEKKIQSEIYVYSPDSTKKAIGSSDGTIKIFNVKNNALLRTINFDHGYTNSLCYSKDGNKLASGGWGYKNIRIYDVSELNNVKENKLPVTYSLSQNYPNPFNPSTVISFQLSVNSKTTLKIFDLLGREVRTLIDEYKPAGAYEITFDAAGLPGGIYFYKLQAGKYSEVRKMVYLR